MELSITDVGGYKLITIAGKVDWENARQLDTQIQAIINSGARHLVFDLDRVSFLCSGAIGALTFNLNKVKAAKGTFFIVSSNEYVNYVFETLRFDAVFSGMLCKTHEEFHRKALNQNGAQTS
jgi:anti-sigma B factor antagonist